MAKGRFGEGHKRRAVIADKINYMSRKLTPKEGPSLFSMLTKPQGGTPEGLRKAGETVRMRRVKITLPELPPFKEDNDDN